MAKMTSPSAIARRAVCIIRWVSCFSAMCRPGVSISRICASGSLRIPRIRRRVVCGRGVTIATLCPTIRFTIVDLPTLVRPPTATNPARCSPIALTALLFDLVEREARRGLLALLLAAALADTEFAARDSDSSREPFCVIGSFGSDQFVHRLCAIMSIGDFLQLGFVITLRGRPADVVGKQALDHPLRPGSPPQFDIDRADPRSNRGGENRVLPAPATFLLALAEPQHLVERNS